MLAAMCVLYDCASPDACMSAGDCDTEMVVLMSAVRAKKVTV